MDGNFALIFDRQNSKLVKIDGDISVREGNQFEQPIPQPVQTPSPELLSAKASEVTNICEPTIK